MATSRKGSGRGATKPPKTSRKKKAAPAKAKPAARTRKTKPRAPAAARRGLPEAPPPPVGLTEEETIRSAKFLPRARPRVFEEERFIFPESYRVNRVRLVVKDPEWLFAYWDVSPATVESLKKEVGERALALSRLTLRISDPVNGGSSDILLAPGARSWYVRTDEAPRSYKAELGLTLPSGAFRRIAESNVVVAPRVGPSSERARRRISYRQARDIPAEAARAAGQPAPSPAAGPWKGTSVDAAQPGPASSAPARGGASDAFRPGGASDVHRR